MDTGVGTDSLHSCVIVIPALDPDGVCACSLSGNVVPGLLKDELGFKGLVFTDALDMKGVSAIPQVTTKALLAGNDMVLQQHEAEVAVNITFAIQLALGYSLKDRILETLVQPHAICHVQSIGRCILV